MLGLMIEWLCAFGLPTLFFTVLVVQCAGDSRPKQARSKDGKRGKRSGTGKRSHKKSSRSRSGKRRSSQSGKGKKSKSRRSSKSKSKGRKSSETGKSPKKSARRKDQSGTGSSKSSKHSGSRSASTSQRELAQGSREDTADSKKDMRMEPVELRWGVKGGVQRVFIRNPTKERRAIKVKCSDNKLYRVNPVYSFVEPGQVLGVDVLRNSGEPKVDKMVFVTAEASIEDEQPRNLFESGEAKPMMVLPLIAVNE